jgi:cation/acetate symporter
MDPQIKNEGTLIPSSSGGQSGFIKKLNKIYLMYVGGFATFVILMAILNANGVPDRVIGYFFLGWTITIFAAVGILSRTGQLTQYYVAGREVPGVYNGMATASDWMSAASFIGMAGTIMILGFDGLPFIMGWTGGYVLLALLIGPYLRKLGAFTIPDFVSSRYGYGENKHVIRVIALIITIVIGFVYIVPQIAGVGLITSRFLGIPFVVGCFVGLLGVLVCSMLGGMRAVTWTQVAQYIVLIIAYLIPVSVLSFQYTGNPIPYLAYGQVIQKITAAEQVLFNSPEEISAREAFAAAGQPARAKEPKPYTAPFVRMDLKNFLILTFCLMLGTTGLPHILMRYYTLPSVREARKSVLWTLFFISLLYLAAPAYSANALLTIYTQLVGTPMADLPGWVTTWSQVGLITITDINVDGLVQFAEIAIRPDMVVLATPEIAGLPYVIAGLIAAGGLAAALSTADGLLLTISNAFAHDLYYKIINPKASANTRLALARTLLVVAAVIAGFVASQNIAIIVELVAWAFSIAASTFFPVLVMGIFWKRATKEGGIAGLLIGLTVCLFYMIGSRFYGLDWFGIRTIGSGIFGIPAAFLSIYVVSLLTPAPPKAVTDLIDTLRYPKGAPRGHEEGLDT